MTDPDQPEARIIPIGQPIETVETLFEGSLVGARAYLSRLPPEKLADVAIWTPGHIFSAAELLAEHPGHAHDPLTSSDA